MKSEVVWKISPLEGDDIQRWGNVWNKRLPVTGVRASQNRADVVISRTYALIINGQLL